MKIYQNMYNYEGTKNNKNVYTNLEPGKNSALGTESGEIGVEGHHWLMELDGIMFPYAK